VLTCWATGPSLPLPLPPPPPPPTPTGTDYFSGNAQPTRASVPDDGGDA
jgi:hypothetical protein